MTLTLQIENETSLPDGGPLSVSITGKRGLDVGRDPYLDWTLPDPSRFISGRHCEVRWREGGYWLHDISTNGTFLNGSDGRLKAPHRLRNGDRLVIGHYVIAVSLEDEDIAGPDVAEPDEANWSRASSAQEDLWNADPAAPPIDPRHLKGPKDMAPVRPDFLDWAADVPRPIANPPASSASVWGKSEFAVTDLHEDSWADGPAPSPPPPPEIIPMPMPRRPEASEPKRPAAIGEPAPPGASPQVSVRKSTEDNLEARFIQAVARGAGLPQDAFAGRDVDELAEQFGRLLKLATENMKQLLEARQQAKRLARSPNQTTVQAVDNNPLKFSPTPEDALRIMFGARGRSYLDAEGAFAQAFGDLKKHQIKTYSAMQRAVTLLMKDVEPEAIEAF
jgi:type VI secretion system protein ImpI